MECHHVEEMLQALMDRNLQTLFPAVEEHLKHCPDCRKVYKDMLWMRDLVRQMPAPNLSTSGKLLLSRSLQQSVKALREPEPLLATRLKGLLALCRRLQWRRLIPVAAATLLILGIFLHSWLSPPAPQKDLQASSDMEFLLQEHAMVLENSIIRAGTPALTLMTLAEEEQ